jgi:cell division protein FtsI/penicillin-binding protein 2
LLYYKQELQRGSSKQKTRRGIMFNPTKEIKKVGTVAVLYGEGGCGKTTVIASAIKESDNGIFVSIGENGLSPLQKDSSVFDLTDVTTLGKTITKWSDPEEGGFIEALRWLATSDYTDIALDSVTLIESSL